jgi:hypothetical protein
MTDSNVTVQIPEDDTKHSGVEVNTYVNLSNTKYEVWNPNGNHQTLGTYINQHIALI